MRQFVKKNDNYFVGIAKYPLVQIRKRVLSFQDSLKDFLCAKGPNQWAIIACGLINFFFFSNGT